MQTSDKELLNIMACPKCKAPVTMEDNGVKCTSDSCGLIYPIREGVPIMLIEEARKNNLKKS